YLVTGWINELSSAPGRLRLHAPVVGSEEAPIAGPVRYEISTGLATDSIAIAGLGHLAYPPTEAGLAAATLTRRLYQSEPREPIERSQFDLLVSEREDSSQVDVALALDGGFEPGYLYELIYEAQDPVLAGAGMSAIRDAVAAIRRDQKSDLLQDLNLPQIRYTIAYGVSQSGRLLRQFVYDGFNADLNGNQVFDGVIPIISGGGFGMFNMRFAMPTRTNGHHSNHLYPNDLFPFTYGNSTDPHTGRQDGVLAKARVAGVEPKLMHIQTVNEYWLRAGSLTHTTADGRADALIPENVRFYTIGGSQHSSGNGRPREASSGQLPPNPSMWSPISDSLIVAMSRWISDMQAPPASRIPRIADGTLLPSHLNGEINPEVWRPIAGYRHPYSMYQPSLNDYGRRWMEERVIDSHPQRANELYVALVPAVDPDNNDLASATVLPPTTKVPLATFVSWNLRAPETGAENSLARLAGGYIPFATTAEDAAEAEDYRNSLEALYGSFYEYMVQYEAATDALIADGFLLSGFKEAYLQIARDNAVFFP
ncbi:MAG: alpha/beta hydrolase domain-containing protein, partial [Pseudomonadota bacterium]|nr:alpha/beta hydrolase domain-containing protein [Pseudomonadota bacterium]